MNRNFEELVDGGLYADRLGNVRKVSALPCGKFWDNLGLRYHKDGSVAEPVTCLTTKPSSLYGLVVKLKSWSSSSMCYASRREVLFLRRAFTVEEVINLMKERGNL